MDRGEIYIYTNYYQQHRLLALFAEDALTNCVCSNIPAKDKQHTQFEQ